MAASGAGRDALRGLGLSVGPSDDDAVVLNDDGGRRWDLLLLEDATEVANRSQVGIAEVVGLGRLASEWEGRRGVGTVPLAAARGWGGAAAAAAEPSVVWSASLDGVGGGAGGVALAFTVPTVRLGRYRVVTKKVGGIVTGPYSTTRRRLSVGAGRCRVHVAARRHPAEAVAYSPQLLLGIWRVAHGVTIDQPRRRGVDRHRLNRAPCFRRAWPTSPRWSRLTREPTDGLPPQLHALRRSCATIPCCRGPFGRGPHHRAMATRTGREEVRQQR